MNWIKNKLRAWLFPEYRTVCQFMAEVEEAKLEVKGKSINFKEPMVLLGNLSECRVNIKPVISIKPEIFMEALLSIMGHNHIVTNSIFKSSIPSNVKGN